jgi:hypothetical protein
LAAILSNDQTTKVGQSLALEQPVGGPRVDQLHLLEEQLRSAGLIDYLLRTRMGSKGSG